MLVELFGMVWAVYVMEVPEREGKAVSIRGDNALVVQWILDLRGRNMTCRPGT